MDYTTTGLINRVKNWAAVPPNQPAFTDANILTFLSDELQMNIAPYIMDLRQEYFLKSVEYAIAGNENYLIPRNALGNTVREMKRVDSDGTELNIRQITMQNLAQGGLVDFSESYFGFIVNGNYIKLINSSGVSGMIKMYYIRRPSVLIGVADCAQIASIAGNDITCVNVPSTWTSSNKFDVVQGTPPFEVYRDDIAAVVTGNVITLDAPAGLVAGDYITITGESPVAQIPWEATAMLCQATIMKLLESLGDTTAINTAAGKYQEYMMRLNAILSPRVDGEVVSIVNDDGWL